MRILGAFFIVALLVFTSLGVLFSPAQSVSFAEDSVVTFPDPNLQKAIRDAIGKPTGDIYQSDLDKLTSLYVEYLSITDLTGLEYCHNLTNLAIRGGEVSDISVLSGLTGLTHLELNDNSISEISVLSGLTGLTYLDLSGNSISDISVLSGLTNLTYLGLCDSHISDISVLSGLTNLRGLCLSYNPISNIDPLAGLYNLNILDLTDSKISNIAPLSSLTNLSILALGWNQISDITAVSHLINLDELALFGNNIDDLTPLSSLASCHLRHLDLDDNIISDISPLSLITSLETLLLEDNLVSDITALAGLTNLHELMLLSNKIVDIKPLVDNPGLASGDHVALHYNPLSSISVNTYIPALQSRGVSVDYEPCPPAPSTPTLASPANGATVSVLTPILSWNPSINAGWYSLQVSNSCSFTAILVEQSDTTDTSYVVPGGALVYGKTYYWRVKAFNCCGNSPWSTVGSFKTPAGPIPNVPSDLSASTILSSQINLTWQDNSNNEKGFKIERRSGTGRYVQIATVGANVLSYKNTGLSANTTYYYRVRAYNYYGNSEYCVEASARTLPAPPPVPVLVSPASGATRVSLTPALSWKSSSGAVSYTVQVSTASNFATTVVNVSGISGTSYSLLSPLKTSTRYYWRVNAVGASGSTSAWSAVRYFTTTATPMPTPTPSPTP